MCAQLGVLAHPALSAIEYHAMSAIEYTSDYVDSSSDDEVFPLTDEPVNPFDSAFIWVTYRNSDDREVAIPLKLQVDPVNASEPVRFAPVAMTCTNTSFEQQDINITMFYNWECVGSRLVTDVSITFNIKSHNVSRTIATSRYKRKPFISGTLIFSKHHKTIRTIQYDSSHPDYDPEGKWNVDATSTFTMDLDMVLGIINMPPKELKLAVTMATVKRLGDSSGLFDLDPGVLRMICDLSCGPCKHARAVVPFVVTVPDQDNPDHDNQEPEIEVAGQRVLGAGMHPLQVLGDAQ